MRNIWKGLVIGGLTGAAAGIVLDLGTRGARLVGVAGKKAVDLVPEAADRIKAEVVDGFARVQEAEIGEHMREQAKQIGHRVAESEQADQAREAMEQATKKGKQIAHAVRDSVPVRSSG